MTRITERQMVRSLVTGIEMNRRTVDKYSNQISSGLKVSEPGDSTFSGTVSSLTTLTDQLNGYQQRINGIKGYYDAQDEVLKQVNDILTRAKEIALQAGNSTNRDNERSALAAEMFQLRDHVVSLGNTKYMGQYLYSGNATDTPAYATTPGTQYAVGSGGGLDRYIFCGDAPRNAAGADDVRNVEISDGLSITLNTPGNQVFDHAIWALERLGRALQGERTDTVGPIDPNDPTTWRPTGTGTAYVMPADYQQQTDDILAAIAMLDYSREVDVAAERTEVAARLNRIDTAESLLQANKTSTSDVLSKLQDADVVDSASQLSMAEQALNASMQVTAKVMGLSILNYL